MDKRTLYDEFGKIESLLQYMLKQMEDMRSSTDELVEQNVNLELENRHLRQRLEEFEMELEQLEPTDENKQGLSKSRLNLEIGRASCRERV